MLGFERESVPTVCFENGFCVQYIYQFYRVASRWCFPLPSVGQEAPIYLNGDLHLILLFDRLCASRAPHIYCKDGDGTDLGFCHWEFADRQ